MKRTLTSISIALMLFSGTTIILAQSSSVSWSTFDMGFAASVSPNTGMKSVVGQSFVGTSVQVTSIIQSGFLADTLQQGSILAIGDKTGLPLTFSLSQNFPNPFNPVTTIRYDLPEQSHVTLVIYDLLGREVRTLVNRMEEPGYRSVTWDATNNAGQSVGAGIYLYRIQVNDYTKTNKMVLIK